MSTTETVSASITVDVRPVHSGANANGNYNGSPEVKYIQNLTSAQLAQCYSDQRSFTGSSETLSVTSGLVNTFGNTINLTTLWVMQIVNQSAFTLTVGGGSNALFGSDQYTIGPGKCVYIDTLFAVSGSAYNIQVASSSSSATAYQIVILGA